MINQEFETFINQHRDLNDLLNLNEIGVFNNFKDPEIQQESFKEYIQDRYLKSFATTVKKYSRDEKDGLIMALFRSIDDLATPAAKQKLVDIYQPMFAKACEYVDQSVGLIHANDMNAIKANVDQFDFAFDPQILGYINNLSNEDTERAQLDGYFNSALNIANHVSKAKPTKNVEQYAIYNAVMNNLKKMKTKMTEDQFKEFQKLENHIEATRDDIEKKSNYWPYIVIAIIVIRILMRIARNS